MDTDCAQMGQAPCPCRASTLPQVGTTSVQTVPQTYKTFILYIIPNSMRLVLKVGHQALLGIVVLSARICQESAVLMFGLCAYSIRPSLLEPKQPFP